MENHYQNNDELYNNGLNYYNTSIFQPTTVSNDGINPEDSKPYRFFVNNSEKNHSLYQHKNNKVDTTKYSILTFIPKALAYQFMRPANVYFLICAILQCIPAISPLSPYTALIPIVIVISV